MTYKFRSRTTGDLTMLEADGARLLTIIGKTPGSTGIILPGQMAAAVQALEAAIDRDDAQRAASADEPADADEAAPARDEVSLRQRALPFVDMLRRCAKDATEIVWGT